MIKQELSKKKKIYLSILFLLVIPVIIFFYFLHWKTNTAYGDDLYMFKDLFGRDSFSDKINLPLSFGKFRPVHGLSLALLIENVQKDLDGYYIFNIAIQTLNTFIFALTLNLFLRSAFFSLLFSLMLGLSRFSFFNISQLLNGGALEGLAMTFFLCSLYFLLRALVVEDLGVSKRQREILLSVLFANLSMYTHERYIVIFPFIVLVVALLPALRVLSVQRRVAIGGAAVGSILLNVAVKKYVYSMPFFVGTGGTNIEFSFSSAFGYLADGILSIIQVNSGPQYLVGIEFESLPVFIKVLVLALVSSFIGILIVYLYRTSKAFAVSSNENRNKFFAFLSLWVLLGFSLVPAVVTIRLEQRWLQASLSIFILLVVIGLSSLNFRNKASRALILSLIAFVFIWIDYNYLYRGAESLYMNYSKKDASIYREAMRDGTIRPETTKLYIWEKQRDDNSENAIKWSLGEGYLFEFYQHKAKELVFVDSLFQRSDSGWFSSIENFNKSTDQIVYPHFKVTDITGDFLEDSLKTFLARRMNELSNPNNVQYDLKKLVITNDDFSKFTVNGFHENENGIRWTNGNASIGFLGDYTIKDSFDVDLNTYMPPVCQNISPKVSLVDYANKAYLPIFTKREGDKFKYTFHFNRSTAIQKITIISDTIDAEHDIRTLSFPFISLELRN